MDVNPYEPPKSQASVVDSHEPSRDDGSIDPWQLDELPEPPALSLRDWASFIGPGIVMMGIQIGGGEWLLGPAVTAKYGGGLMWIATVAIVLQVFYNIECGRYAMYCGEPIFTGFMRCAPGPRFWFGFMLLLNISALVPGLSTHAAAMIASLWLDRPPGPDDTWLITPIAYALLIVVALPVLVGGKVYDLLQGVMTAKVFLVLGFCFAIGLMFVSWSNWASVFSGFVKFGNVPVVGADGKETLANGFTSLWRTGTWPAMSTAALVSLGAFAGYAGGGGLANSTYSNFVRDKGWGMGRQVGAIASAIGSKNVILSHVGKVFKITPENMERWRGWWRHMLFDQLLVWAPGCFMGMALPALLSMEFAPSSTIPEEHQKYAQAVITADGLRHATLADGTPRFSPVVAKVLWIVALLTGMVVMLPSQMSILDDFSRRWTDAIWSSSRHVQRTFQPHQVNRIYYAILGGYVAWSFFMAWAFSNAPRAMTDFIANFNNLAIGLTSFLLIWINLRLLPKELRPKWWQTTGTILCGVFYMGLTGLVFWYKILPMWTPPK